MSKAQTLTISVNPTDNNAAVVSYFSRPSSFFGSNTWADVSVGAGSNVSLVVGPRQANQFNPSNTFTVSTFQASFIAVFGGTFRVTRSLFIIDVSDIGPDTEFLPKTMNLFSGNKNKPSATNVVSDHSIILAKPDATLFNAVQAAGIGYSGGASDFTRIEGWTAQQDNSSAITPYSAELDYAGGVTSGIVQSGMTFTLTEQAKQDIFNNDFFCFWILDFDYDVRFRSPQTESPSPGSTSAVATNIFMIDGQNSGGTQVEGIKVNYLQGGIKPTSVTKERIENDFTINSFADITDQRGRLNVNGVIADQIPYLLGVKGPLSLRGRQFTDEGKPISTTVDPPNTSKS